MTKSTITEAATVTLDTEQFRRAVSAAANAAKTLTAALEFTSQDERNRLKGAADECIDGLAALAFAQIRRMKT
jgi:hypothetical protein